MSEITPAQKRTPEEEAAMKAHHDQLNREARARYIEGIDDMKRRARASRWVAP